MAFFSWEDSSYLEIKAYIKVFDRLSDIRRKLILDHICHEYHDKDIVTELILRLIYEILSNHIQLNDVMKGSWRYCSFFIEKNHALRLKILHERIKRNKTALERVSKIQWISMKKLSSREFRSRIL